MTDKKTTIRWDRTQEQRELMEKWQELFGFSSQKQTVEFLQQLGYMVLELTVEGHIDAHSFANALYTIGTKYFNAEIDGRVRETVEEFKAWREKNLEGVNPQRTLSRSNQMRQITR